MILDSEADKEAWQSVVDLASNGVVDIYFSSDWISLHLEENSLGRLFVYQSGEELLVYPFILNSIDHILGIDVTDRGWTDIESAYGYGGAIANSVCEKFLSAARTEFEQWCQTNRVVCEFVRFHPLISNERFIGSGESSVTIHDDRTTVSINTLGLDDSTEVMPYSKEARYMVRRAVREGVEAEIIQHPSSQGFEDFVKMYLQTMKNVGADRFYHFSGSYFEKLKDLIDKSGFVVNAIDRSGKIGSSSLFLVGSNYGHYHLSARMPDCVPGIGNLVIDAAARHCGVRGLERLHLGGGLTAGRDPLFKFKESLGTDFHPFRIGTSVHDSESYEQIRTLWKSNGGVGSSRLQFYRVDTGDVSPGD